MSSEVKANKLSPATGTALQISDSGDTTTIPSGATLDVSSATMTGFTIPSGQTLTVASGATITNSGTATGTFYSPTPMWFAYANSDQTGVTDATWTKVTNLGAEAIDSDGAYATGTQTFTVPADKAGKYYIFGSCVPGSGATSTMNAGGAAIYVDGVKYADFVMDIQANPGFKIAAHVSAIIDLAVGEAVTIYGYGDITAGSPAFYSSGFTKGGRFFGWRLSA